MKISIITDELSSDVASAIELGTSWGCDTFEIRNAWLKRMPNAPDILVNRIWTTVQTYGVTVSGISPGIFKGRTNDDYKRVKVFADSVEEIEFHQKKLVPASFEFAERLGTKVIVVFSFVRPTGPRDPEIPDAVVDYLGPVANEAEARGLTLALETEHGTWADSGENARKIVDAVGSKGLQINWDPSNIIAGHSGEDAFSVGYEHAKGAIANVHVKDVTKDPVTGENEWSILGEGDLDWNEHLKVLKRDGYDGYVSLEPHFRFAGAVNVIDKCRRTFETLQSYLNEVDD